MRRGLSGGGFFQCSKVVNPEYNLPVVDLELIAERSKKEYQEMIDGINKEREQQEEFEKFAAEMGAFYDEKLKK